MLRWVLLDMRSTHSVRETCFDVVEPVGGVAWGCSALGEHDNDYE
jgi:hypothetical protein